MKIKRTITTVPTYEEIEREAIETEQPAYDAEAMADENGEDWKKCSAYQNFRPESVLPFFAFYNGSKYVHSGHYSFETLEQKDENGLNPVQRFQKKFGQLAYIFVYDPAAPFGQHQYELI